MIIVEAVPADGARDVPVSVVPRLTFAVPLDPASVGPDAFRLASGELVPGGTVRYSVVERAISFTPGVNLRARLAYVARLGTDVRGLDGSVPREPVELVFVTGSDDLGRLPAPPEPSFQEDVAPLAAARCAFCHSGATPAGGLSLADSAALLAAATRLSDEWVGWAVIAAGAPERSYLLYKVTDAPGIVGQPMPPGASLTLDEALALERWIAAGAQR